MDRLAQAPILLVEPHFDDAALSCCALLDREVPLDILTALAGEPDPPRQGDWDRICGFSDSRAGMATRAAESAAALAGLPHRVSALPLLEAQYAGVRDPGDSARLQRAIGDWVRGNSGGLVALPAGAGRQATSLRQRITGRKRIRTHPDHLFVRDAGLAALDDGWTPLLYEELPYFAGGSAAQEVERLAGALGRDAVVAEPTIDRRQKAARIAAFRSQVRLISPPEMPLDDPSALPAIERYWLLER